MYLHRIAAIHWFSRLNFSRLLPDCLELLDPTFSNFKWQSPTVSFLKSTDNDLPLYPSLHSPPRAFSRFHQFLDKSIRLLKFLSWAASLRSLDVPIVASGLVIRISSVSNIGLSLLPLGLLMGNR